MRKFRSWKTGDIETRDITRYPIKHIGKISIFIEGDEVYGKCSICVEYCKEFGLYRPKNRARNVGEL